MFKGKISQFLYSVADPNFFLSSIILNNKLTKSNCRLGGVLL